MKSCWVAHRGMQPCLDCRGDKGGAGDGRGWGWGWGVVYQWPSYTPHRDHNGAAERIRAAGSSAENLAWALNPAVPTSAPVFFAAPSTRWAWVRVKNNYYFTGTENITVNHCNLADKGCIIGYRPVTPGLGEQSEPCSLGLVLARSACDRGDHWESSFMCGARAGCSGCTPNGTGSLENSRRVTAPLNMTVRSITSSHI